MEGGFPLDLDPTECEGKVLEDSVCFRFADGVVVIWPGITLARGIGSVMAVVSTLKSLDLEVELAVGRT